MSCSARASSRRWFRASAIAHCCLSMTSGGDEDAGVGGLTAGGFLSTYSYEMRPRLLRNETSSYSGLGSPVHPGARASAAARVSSHPNGCGWGGWMDMRCLLTGTIAYEPRDIQR